MIFKTGDTPAATAFAGWCERWALAPNYRGRFFLPPLKLRRAKLFVQDDSALDCRSTFGRSFACRIFGRANNATTRIARSRFNRLGLPYSAGPAWRGLRTATNAIFKRT